MQNESVNNNSALCFIMKLLLFAIDNLKLKNQNSTRTFTKTRAMGYGVIWGLKQNKAKQNTYAHEASTKVQI